MLKKVRTEGFPIADHESIVILVPLSVLFHSENF
jgi:hypothetical protein